MSVKKCSLLIAAVALAIAASAQTEHGSLLLGTSFTTAFQKHRTPLLDATARGGYFIKNNLMLGVETNFNHFKVNPDLLTNSKLSGGLLARQYFNLGESRFKFFAEAGAGAGRSWGDGWRFKPDIGIWEPSPYTGNFAYLKGALGTSYQLTKNLSLEASVDHRIYLRKNNTFGESKIRVGLNYHFTSKKAQKR